MSASNLASAHPSHDRNPGTHGTLGRPEGQPEGCPEGCLERGIRPIVPRPTRAMSPDLGDEHGTERDCREQGRSPGGQQDARQQDELAGDPRRLGERVVRLSYALAPKAPKAPKARNARRQAIHLRVERCSERRSVVAHVVPRDHGSGPEPRQPSGVHAVCTPWALPWRPTGTATPARWWRTPAGSTRACASARAGAEASITVTGIHWAIMAACRATSAMGPGDYQRRTRTSSASVNISAVIAGCRPCARPDA